MENIRQLFLQEISRQLKLQDNQAQFFPVRFHLENRDLTDKECLKEAGIFGSIDHQAFRNKIIQQYKQQMKLAGVDVEGITNLKPGQKGISKIIFDWLWQHQYLQWIEAQGLSNWFEKLKQKALVNGLEPWLSFRQYKSKSYGESCRDLDGDDDVPEYEEIGVGIPYVMSVQLPQVTSKDGYLIILYKSQDTMRFMSPSQAFAVNNNTREFPVEIPIQSNQQGEKPSKRNLKLTTKGEDEFLGIWINERFTLDELNTSEKIPAVTPKYIDLIFETIAKSDECHIFHRLCRVV